MPSPLRTTLATAATTALAVGGLAVDPAGAVDDTPNVDWPAAADIPSNHAGIVIDTTSGGLDAVWVLDHRVDDDDIDLAARCRAAGLTAQQCRRILNQTDRTLAERCRAAGLTTEQCRRIVSHGGDDQTLAERCRAAGFTTEECREILAGSGDDVRPDRVRPDAVRPDVVRPDAVRPDVVRSGERSDAVGPDLVRPQPTRPETDRPAQVRPRTRPVQLDRAPTTAVDRPAD